MNTKDIKKIYEQATETILDLYTHPDHVLIIHYSCSSFHDKNEKSPRIISIAIRKLNSRQTESYSIAYFAELEKIYVDDIESNYEFLEKKLLDKYFEFQETHKTFKWVHWNMKDINFGFKALNHRYRVLGGKPNEIDDKNKYDLSKLLKDKYGDNYIDHPKFEKILDKNLLKSVLFLNGAEEAKYFETKHYMRVSQSTMCKVNDLENLLKYSAKDELKTNSKNFNKYGKTVQGITDAISEHWIVKVILLIAGVCGITGVIMGVLVFL